MDHIFVSYRRGTTSHIAQTINERLCDHFGEASVFFDIDTIPLGFDFRQHISQYLHRTSVLLVIIGDDWNAPRNGIPRLKHKNDFVRLEIEIALARGIPILPVIVGDADIPSPRELPKSIQELSYRNAAILRAGRERKNQLKRLIKGVERLMAVEAERKAALQEKLRQEDEAKRKAALEQQKKEEEEAKRKAALEEQKKQELEAKRKAALDAWKKHQEELKWKANLEEELRQKEEENQRTTREKKSRLAEKEPSQSRSKTSPSRKPKNKRQQGTSQKSKSIWVLLFSVIGGLLIILFTNLYQNTSLSPENIYATTSTYASLITRGDSLYDLAFTTQDTVESLKLYKDARENYLAAQLIQKNPSIKRRIADIEEYLENPSLASSELDAKASLALIAAGDSLIRVAEGAIGLYGDSVRANILYVEARKKYFSVFEAFPDDSLANARLRMVNNLMVAPAKVLPADDNLPSEEQIQEKLFVLYKEQGDAALADQNYDEARRKYIDALKQKPGDTEVSRLLEDTNRAIASDSRRKKYQEHMKNGDTLLSHGRLAEARREYELALETMPNNREAVQQIFDIDTRLRDQERRQQEYLDYRTRGDLLLKQKKYEEALASYEAALDAIPDDEYAKAKIEETKRDIAFLANFSPDYPPGMVDDNGIFNYTEQPAVLIGGIEVLQSRIRYPARAFNANIEGRVVLQMLVDETGRMSSVTVIKSLGYGCDEEALRVIRGARFKPAKVGGQPVASWHRMFFEFTR